MLERVNSNLLRKNNILSEAKSVCPVCIEKIDAGYSEENGKVYFIKTCPKHGRFKLLVSENAGNYRDLKNFYFYFIPAVIAQKEYYLNVTTKCDIRCPVCYLDHCDQLREMSFERVKEVAGFKDIKRLTLSHGEPTSCDNLFEIIKILRCSGKLINMHTNGIKLADFKYASDLKKTGIDHISLQFDGFRQSTYSNMRGKDILDAKFQALKNLKKLAIPTTLNITVAKNINEDETGKIFEYAVGENFIKDISFITFSQYDYNPDTSNNYIVPDELIKYLESYTKGRISRNNIISFQKLFYAYISVFGKRKCFNYYHYLVVRQYKGYQPIDSFIDLSRAEKMLAGIKDKNKKLNLWRLLGILIRSLKFRGIACALYGLKLFIQRGYPDKPGRFLCLTFATICDPLKYDFDIANNCGQGIIGENNIYDSYGDYLISQMKKNRLNYESCICK